MTRRRLFRRRLYRWALSLAAMLRQPRVHLLHRLRFKVVAGPGLLGFRGGVLNPGAVHTAEHGIIVLAKGHEQHWLDTDASNYLRGSPVALRLERNLRVASASTVAQVGFPATGVAEIEDFRLFAFTGKIWANHNLVEKVQTGTKPGYLSSRVCISQLDAATNTLTFLGHPQIDFQTQPREKNWAFVEVRDDLYLLYSVRPYRVLKLIDRANLHFATVISRTLDIDFRTIGGFAAPVSYSTNPIHYDDDHWLVLLHQSTPITGGRVYLHWGLLLDKNSLEPKKMTARPLLSGSGARGALRGVLYVASVLKVGDDFVLFSGEGDSYVTRTTIPKQKLDRLWSSVDDIGGTH